MLIKAIKIQNFRNLQDIEIEFDSLSLIIGPNNSGKTNILAAFEKVLRYSPTRLTQIARTDFAEPTSPILIEVTFHELTEDDIAAYNAPPGGLINPLSNTLKVQLRATWDIEEQGVLTECNFIRDDLESNTIKENFSRRYSRYITYLFTNSFEEVDPRLTLSQRRSFGRLIRRFAGDYLKPINVLLSHVSDTLIQLRTIVDSIPDELPSATHRDLIYSGIEPIEAFCAMDNLSQIVEPTEFDDIIAQLSEALNTFEQMDNLITESAEQDGLVDLLDKLDRLSRFGEALNQRIEIRKDLIKWSTRLDTAQPFQAANERLTSVINNLLVDQNISLRMLPIEDEELISSVSAMLDGFPVDQLGDGYKSIFNIGLGLAEFLQDESLDSFRSSTTCLFIEGIERNLHPHMQRHIINQLKQLQEEWRLRGRHLQLVLTTHSPACLKTVSLTEVIRLRSDTRHVKWHNENYETLAATLTPAKSLINLQRWGEKLLYEHAEVLFSEVVIVVEGYTELGFVGSIIERRPHTEYHGITTINAASGDNIQYISSLLNKLEIEYVCIVDEEKEGKSHDLSMIPQGRHFPTKEVAFEKTVLATKCYQEIIKALEICTNEQSLQNRLTSFQKQFPTVSNYSDLIMAVTAMDSEQEKFLIDELFKWMQKEKGVELGKQLGDSLGESKAPSIYIDAVNKAESIAKRTIQ